MRTTATVIILTSLFFANSSSADLQSLQNFLSSCYKPDWLTARNPEFVEDKTIYFPDAVRNNETNELTHSFGNFPRLAVEVHIPRPENYEIFPDFFYIGISTPSDMPRQSVAQIQNYHALRRRHQLLIDGAELREFKSNFSLASLHVDQEALQHFKEDVDIKNGNTPKIISFWKAVTDYAYSSVINPSFNAHRGEETNLYDHLLGYRSFPDNLQDHYSIDEGAVMRLSKRLVTTGTAWAFILDPAGECMYSKEIQIVD